MTDTQDAPQQQQAENDIWSKLEAERKRRTAIRRKMATNGESSDDGSGPLVLPTGDGEPNSKSGHEGTERSRDSVASPTISTKKESQEESRSYSGTKTSGQEMKKKKEHHVNVHEAPKNPRIGVPNYNANHTNHRAKGEHDHHKENNGNPPSHSSASPVGSSKKSYPGGFVPPPHSGASTDSSILSNDKHHVESAPSPKSHQHNSSTTIKISHIPVAPDLAHGMPGPDENSEDEEEETESLSNASPHADKRNAGPQQQSSKSSVTSLTSNLTQSPGLSVQSGDRQPRRKLKFQTATAQKNSAKAFIPRVNSIDSLKSMENPTLEQILSQDTLAEEDMEAGDASTYDGDSQKMRSKETQGKSIVRQDSVTSDNDNHSRRSRSGRPPLPTFGSVRAQIDKDSVPETESWVYLVAVLLFLFTSAGLSCIILFVFGAAGAQVSREQRIQEAVLYLSPEGAFESPTSPQSLATSWLANDDEAKIDEKDRERLENRYVLAVLYYSTGGDDIWKNRLNFLSALHECEWHQTLETLGEEVQAGGVNQGVTCDDDSKIVDLSIVSNTLRGRLPMELSGLSNLINLDLSRNRLSGTLPSLTFSQLEGLNLGYNTLEGAIYADYSGLTALTMLDLSVNSLSSTIPESMGELTNIETLRLGFNNLEGIMSEELKSMTRLSELNLTSNAFSGSMDFLKNFPLLEVLDVSSNKLDGGAPFVIGGLTFLEHVAFSNNRVQGALPTTIGFLQNLRYFAADNNFLTGSFPWSFFPSNNRLEFLSLNGNALEGTFPSDISKFGKLELVDIGRNQLSGSLPSRVSGMPKLKVLRAQMNRLSGPLPVELGLVEALEILDLSGNLFSNTIPSSFGSLSTLKELRLHANQLSGTVPVELRKLKNIDVIGLHSNTLNGDIEFLCEMTPLPWISADCGGIPPAVECPCCMVCVSG